MKFYGPANEVSGNYLVRYKIVRQEEDLEKRQGILNSVGKTVIACLASVIDVCDVVGPGPYVKEVELYRPNLPTFVPNVKKSETFTVRLEKPFLITPNLMTTIKFELEGPETECGRALYDPIQVTLSDKTKVTFDFVRGSSQLPELLFTI